MATATVSRPVQAPGLRQRDRGPRPSLSKRSITGTADTASEPAHKKRRLAEPYVRTSEYVLHKHRGKMPSLVIHLHDSYFRFDGQEGSFAYDSPMRPVVEHLRAQTVPHEIMGDLLAAGVPFYDGCLIVEVHNHKTARGKDKGKQAVRNGDADKFSMHKYNEHITPSPFAPYPAKARMEEAGDKAEASSSSMPAPEKPAKEKDKDGPKVTTMVLHPTERSKHHDILLLAETPLSELLRGKKKIGDAGAPSGAQPPTPSLSVPPTPSTSRGPLSQSQKMCLEQGDYYSIQGEMLVASEAPLYLGPVKTPEEAEKVLDVLSNPLHMEKPPSPKTRKRTTAEMAQDEAEAAEAERRMLLMDDRIKPSARAGAGAPANENQGAAASLGFSRFKTLEMVRQKHEEQERLRKEEEARAAIEKKHTEEQNAIKQQQMMHAAKQQQLMAQQQQANNRQILQQRQQQQEQMRAQQMAAQAHAQQAAAAAQAQRDHAHPPNGQMMQNGQQGFQHQGSPVARQLTPMVNSSPMLNNGGFPMVPTSSQGAGSPPRPTSAAMPNRNVPMARQVSQQQHGSQTNTPVIPQGTPSMGQAMPNRQMTQTPRMGPGSPANAMHGTPNSASMQPMPTPHMGQQGLTHEQMLMLQQVRNQQQNNMAGSPNGMPNLTPEQMQAMRNQALMMRQRGVDPRMAQQQAQMHMMRLAQQQRAQQQQMTGQASSPIGPVMHPHATPRMGHGHPQTPHQQGTPHPGMHAGNNIATQQQTQEAQIRAHHIQQQRTQTTNHLRQLLTQYGGWGNIPPHVVQSLPMQVQQMLAQQRAKQAQVLQQQQARMLAQQQNGGAGDQQVPGNPNPQFMQQLRHNQAVLAAQMQQHGGQGLGGQGMGGGMAMNINMPQQQQHNNGGGGNNLDQHFANMHNALSRSGQQQ
jgi:transcription factor SPT20